MTKRSSKVFQGMFLSRFNAQVMYRKVDGEVKPLCLVQVGLGNLGLSCYLENDLQTNKFYKNFIQNVEAIGWTC